MVIFLDEQINAIQFRKFVYDAVDPSYRPGHGLQGRHCFVGNQRVYIRVDRVASSRKAKCLLLLEGQRSFTRLLWIPVFEQTPEGIG